MTKVGILGAGGMGNVHARQYRKMPDVEILFFDPVPDRSEAFRRRWDARPSLSLAQLLSECDLIDICVPTDLHVELTEQALAAGRPVFLEKPIAGTLEDGVRLMRAAERAGLPLMPGQVVRFFPEFAEGNRLVREGKIGRPGVARTRRGGLAPTGSDSWFMDHTRSGGVLIDLAIHDFDWLRWTLGEVRSVSARSIGARSMQGPDYGLTTLQFKSGAIAHVEATWMDPGGFRTAYEVAGSEGLIEFDSRKTPTVRTIAGPKPISEAPLHPLDDPYYRQLRGFLNAVRDHTPPPVTAYDGVMALSIAQAALLSAQTGQSVQPTQP